MARPTNTVDAQVNARMPLWFPADPRAPPCTLNTSAGQFGTSTSDHSLTPDNTPIVVTLFQLHGIVAG
jgi:hypothetical protein